MSSTTHAPPTNGDAKAKALVDEFLEEKAREAPPKEGQRHFGSARLVLSAVLAAVCAAVWFAPLPSRSATTDLDPLLHAASARTTVFLAAAKVQEFRARNGRLPATLAAARVVEPSLDYDRVNDSVFTISASAAGQQITLDSRRDPREFLGGAAAIIERKGRGK